MAYLSLLGAGLLEIAWAFSLSESHGFTRLGPSVLTIVLVLLSFYLLNHAIARFGVGITYAVFTGIGTAGTAIVGMLFLGETAAVGKLVALAVLLIGIVGLNLLDRQGGQ